MMGRTVAVLVALLVVAASVMIACAGDPLDPVPTRPATPTSVAAALQPTGIATASDASTPAATVRPVATVTVVTAPPPATHTRAPPTDTLPSVSTSVGTALHTATLERFLIRLRDDLDDPLGYCVDVRGFGAGIRLDADLQAHSCKTTTADDQSFASIGGPVDSSIVLVDYRVCLAVPEPEIGALILLAPCDDASVSRRFEWLADGRLQLLTPQDGSQSVLCIGVAGGVGEPAGGRNHLRRDLMLRDCAETDLALLAWKPAANR